MATEDLLADALVSDVNYEAGAVLADFNDDPDADLDSTPDYGDWDANGNTIVILGFPTPTGNPRAGAGLQTFRCAARKADSTGANDVVWVMDVYEAGVLFIASIASGTWADSTTKTIVSGTWDATGLADASGADVEIRIVQTSGGTGQAANRRAVEVGGVEWNVDYTEGGGLSIPIVMHHYKQMSGAN